MNIFEKAFTALEKVFTSDKAKAALTEAAALAVQAAPIVAAIEALVPSTNRTVQAVEAAYAKYAVPVATQITNDPTSINNALLNLASTLLAKNLPAQKAGIATSLLNTAVQLAVTAVKA
jgi:hypothetical protein